MTMYLRNKRDGFIYEWNEILSKNPLCEEVTEEEAYPERFVPAIIAEKAEEKRGRKKREPINLHTDDVPTEPSYTNPELNAEASRGLTK